MDEIEFKFLVKKKSALLKKLAKLARRVHSRRYELNQMYDNPAGLMQTTNGRIRVRTLEKSGRKELAYKKPLPVKKGQPKREIEHEIAFRDPSGQIEAILSAMEFSPTTCYERYRTGWQKSKVKITLDEYPHAVYLEIEGPEKAIRQTAKNLGFRPAYSLSEPADTLFQKWRQTKRLPFKPHLRFDDYNQ